MEPQSEQKVVPSEDLDGKLMKNAAAWQNLKKLAGMYASHLPFHLRADPGNGPCQRQVLAEYINNNNIPPASRC